MGSELFFEKGFWRKAKPELKLDADGLPAAQIWLKQELEDLKAIGIARQKLTEYFDEVIPMDPKEMTGILERQAEVDRVQRAINRLINTS